MNTRAFQRFVAAMLTGLGLLLGARHASAAVPPSITHQGRLYDAKMSR
ncbi:MAG: hypothetical protein QM820_39805 [Minicystis sp.]